jgi:dipeptidyl aminopeptidase/acylaminoacyl peptidase
MSFGKQLPRWAAVLAASFVLLLRSGRAAPPPAAAAVGGGGGDEGERMEREVARLAGVGRCFSPSFSPDGLRLAFVSNLSGVPQVWTVPVDGGWPEMVTGFQDPVGQVEWSPDGRWLAFSLAPGGGMHTQIYLVHPDGRQLTMATDGGKVDNNLSGWSHDGRQLLLTSTRTDPAALDPFTYEVASGAWRRVAASGGLGNFSDLSRDGREALIERVRQRGDGDVFAVDLASGRETRLTPHSGPGSFNEAVFASDGGTVYFTSDKDRDRVALARVRLSRSPGEAPAAGVVEVIAARDDADLEDFQLSEDGHTAALLWNAAGRSEVGFLDLATMAQAGAPALPGEVAHDLTFSKNGRLVALTLGGARLPDDVWILDRAGLRWRQVTHAPHPGVDLATLVAPELVRFAGLDGLPLSGWLYRPAGRPSGAGPVVLSFHGGPEAEERPAFSALYQELLAHGIAVFAPNVRGSAGFGKRFLNLDNGALRVGAVGDIRAAVEMLVHDGIADPRRVGIMGGSYGGYMTLAGLTEYPELFAAGADLYGIVNFATFFAHTEPWMAAISKVEYGDPDTQQELLRSLSPLHKLDRVRAPTLVLHGANDTNVPVVEAEQVVAALRQRGVPVEYVLFPDEGHGFRKTVNRIRSAAAITRWFERYLVQGAGAAAGATAPGGSGSGAAPGSGGPGRW